MPRRPHDLHPLLATGRWFASLPGPVATMLLDLAVLREVPANGYLARRDEPASGLFAVVDGGVGLESAIRPARTLAWRRSPATG